MLEFVLAKNGKSLIRSLQRDLDEKDYENKKKKSKKIFISTQSREEKLKLFREKNYDYKLARSKYIESYVDNEQSYNLEKNKNLDSVEEIILLKLKLKNYAYNLELANKKRKLTDIMYKLGKITVLEKSQANLKYEDEKIKYRKLELDLNEKKRKIKQQFNLEDDKKIIIKHEFEIESQIKNMTRVQINRIVSSDQKLMIEKTKRDELRKLRDYALYLFKKDNVVYKKLEIDSKLQSMKYSFEKSRKEAELKRKNEELALLYKEIGIRERIEKSVKQEIENAKKQLSKGTISYLEYLEKVVELKNAEVSKLNSIFEYNKNLRLFRQVLRNSESFRKINKDLN